MPFEIEKKFLVSGEQYKQDAEKQVRIVQGYLSTVPERTVRIRIKANTGYLTIKGKGNQSGATRYEWEKEISVGDAKELLALCESGVIDKTRFLVKSGKHTFEVDEFYGDNQGLVVAEVELESEDEAFEKPSWLAEEVTGQNQYYNAMLMAKPFKNW
ncbi:CYTH domain-containing protein [sulfur-oxidizing endosymbiont of Gigantopelta aegis]|uniref:CYTH domain-containing protein n=1 Tax=sulfur-oxidizing endosymbiont of Gigantopelta aegis TaxID=2794934 RepID=UPI0018DB7E92|nr:CYTH domain-containing protein [sulfur-oxidizing endosymbiont of Gigantopelta aegis]